MKPVIDYHKNRLKDFVIETKILQFNKFVESVRTSVTSTDKKSLSKCKSIKKPEIDIKRH